GTALGLRHRAGDRGERRAVHALNLQLPNTFPANANHNGDKEDDDPIPAQARGPHGRGLHCLRRRGTRRP
ncbi:hypothetical protein DSI41_11990, partial [Mycobacterium tuberculosis]